MKNFVKLVAICSLAFGAYFLTVSEAPENSDTTAQIELVASAQASSPGMGAYEQCIEREKQARGCMGRNVNDPRWSAACPAALMQAMAACKSLAQ